MRPGRGPVTVATAAAGLVVVLAAQAAGSPLGSVAWALLAGVGLSLMLRGFSLRIVGIALATLAVAGAGWAAVEARWIELGGFVVAAVAAAGFVVWGPGWVRRPSAGPRAGSDPWKAMDEGIDPTDGDEQDMRQPGGPG